MAVCSSEGELVWPPNSVSTVCLESGLTEQLVDVSFRPARSLNLSYHLPRAGTV